jgi:two-component system sensor histidine kinase/response regulator
MNPFKNRQEHNSEEALQQSLFKEYYPMVLSIVDELQPLLQLNVDQREVLAMASMMLGQLTQRGERVGRREMRKAIEQYIVETFALEKDRKMLLDNGDGGSFETDRMAGSRILVVDDSAMARRQIQFFLKKDGYEVYEAKSGEEALWLVDEVDPELILMDVSMDGMDGLETCRRLKENPENSTLPVIFLSAKGEREEIVSGFKSGAIDYIVKPFHPAESLTRIRTHLRVKKLAELREKNILELKHLNKTKDRVLRIASHDLRNPVAAIAGLAEFLKDDCDNLSEGQKEIVDCIEEAGKSVVLLLNELLDLSAIDSGHFELNKEDLSLCELVRNLVPLFRGEAERKNLLLSFDCQEKMPPTPVDRQQIRRVIDNLLSNALKFTPSGGMISVSVKPHQQGVCLQVDDTGPGIPEEEADRLFVEFGTTSNVPTGGEKSTGLGLSICQRIVSAHNGNINYKNLPEGGARFSVILPFAAE